jgi:DNA invertase Pin-like site-specific DNA recombinase
VSSIAQRPQLEAALDYLRDGDVLVITKLDRLARSVAHLVAIGGQLESKGVGLKVLEQAIDTSTPTGRLMFNMLGSIAQFERELMLERQREGIARAKAEGKYKGRKPTAKAKTPEIKRLMADGIGATAIARQLGISRASVSDTAPSEPPRGLSDAPTMVWPERDFHVVPTPGALQGDDVQLEYYEDGYPRLPACLDRRRKPKPLAEAA